MHHYFIHKDTVYPSNEREPAVSMHRYLSEPVIT